MKKLFVFLFFIKCSHAEFQKFTDESLIHGRWRSVDVNETIIFDTDAHTMNISGSGAFIDYKSSNINGEFTIDGFIADNKIVSPIITVEIRINRDKNKIRLTNLKTSEEKSRFIVYEKIE